MKVLITGSRTWTDKEAIRRELEIFDVYTTTIVHGAHWSGADKLANEVAEEIGFFIHKYPANWTAYGKAAGPIRNAEMIKLEHKPHDPINLCLAFLINESNGTRGCMNLCVNAGIPVKRIP